MEAFKHKDLNGAMFPYNKKGNDKSPDMKGYMTLSGETYIISGWNNNTSQEIPYISVKLSKLIPINEEGEA